MTALLNGVIEFSIVKMYINIWTDKRHYERDKRVKKNPNSKYELDKTMDLENAVHNGTNVFEEYIRFHITHIDGY